MTEKLGCFWLQGCQGHIYLCLQVVLLGDHKQLRPVVKNEHLRNLGMDRSLFERYHRDAILLDTQYRMHKDICSFPSMEFYGSRLKTWPNLKRLPSILGHAGKESCAVIFGYVQGHEQRLLVSTEDGNENSRANPEEVTEVVSVKTILHGVRWVREEEEGEGQEKLQWAGRLGSSEAPVLRTEEGLGFSSICPLIYLGPHHQTVDPGQDSGSQRCCHPYTLQCTGCCNHQGSH